MLWSNRPINDEDREMAALIVRAVNSHAALVEALRCAQSDIRQLRLQLFGNGIEGPAQAKINAALALATNDD